MSARYASASAMAGGIEVVKDPPRHLPGLFGRGTDDDLFLDAYNAREGTDHTVIPLPFAEAMTIVGDQLVIQAETLGLQPAIRALARRPTSRSPRGRRPSPARTTAS